MLSLSKHDSIDKTNPTLYPFSWKEKGYTK